MNENDCRIKWMDESKWMYENERMIEWINENEFMLEWKNKLMNE